MVLKGDLPTTVDRNNMDTWACRNLFWISTSTGAPLDYFHKDGQNWALPITRKKCQSIPSTYNEVMLFTNLSKEVED